MNHTDGLTVLDYLTYVEHVARDADRESLALVAADELLRMIPGWRAVLAAHAPDVHGRCHRCSPWWWPRTVPCSIWAMVEQHLVAAAPAVPTGPVLVVGGPR